MTFRGTLANGPAADAGSDFQLTTDGRFAYGVVWTPGGSRELRLIDGRLIALEPTPGPFTCGCDSRACDVASKTTRPAPTPSTGMIPVPFSKASAVTNSGAPCFSNDDKTFTVLLIISRSSSDILFGPNPSEDQIDVYAEAAIETVNTSLANSGLDFQAVLVGASVEDGLPDADFNNLPTGEFFVEELALGPIGEAIRAQRDETCADLVATVGFLSNAGGIALLGVGEEALGYSVTSPNVLFSLNILAHELGHNFGANHELELGGPSFLPEARGYLYSDGLTGQPTNTIMGVATAGSFPFNRVPFYSSPDTVLNGVPIGIDGVVDATGAFQTTIPVVTRYRERPVVSPDPGCDGDPSPDIETIASNPAIDMNFNGLIDTCELSNDPSLDCDGNGLLDVSERLGLFGLDLGTIELSPDAALSLPIPAGLPEQISGPATLVVRVDASAAAEQQLPVTITLSNGQDSVEILTINAGCDERSETYIPISESDFATLRSQADTGIASVGATTTSALPETGPCGTPLTASFTLLARRSLANFDSQSIDADLDGLLDTCECAADINGDGQLGADDFNAWLNAFLTGDPVADQNNDGQLGSDDFNTWLMKFLNGCG
ncbi:MAG: GC-type dockerin domain-anchored protein [Planctomycetota bacterium]